jgi:hypothetical protein
MAQYNNAVLSLTKTETPDPYITYSAATRQFYLVGINQLWLAVDVVLMITDIYCGRPRRAMEG